MELHRPDAYSPQLYTQQCTHKGGGLQSQVARGVVPPSKQLAGCPHATCWPGGTDGQAVIRACSAKNDVCETATKASRPTRSDLKYLSEKILLYAVRGEDRVHGAARNSSARAGEASMRHGARSSVCKWQIKLRSPTSFAVTPARQVLCWWVACKHHGRPHAKSRHDGHPV